MYFPSLIGIVLVSLIVTSTPHLAAQKPSLTIGLIGDSTVADTYGWGPAFAKRFDDDTRVLNFAKNGATLDSLTKKLDELLLQKPDYVLIQFGHNDQKRYAPDAYQDKLSSYVQRIQKAGGRPLILSSVTRRNFGSDGKILLSTTGLTADLSVFAKAARAVAKQHDVPFIDLHSVSVAHHNRLGPEASAAYNFNETDRTHFSELGAAATADLIIQELKTAVPAIAANRRLPHPDAVPNTHPPGEVDNPKLVPFIVKDFATLPGIVIDEMDAELVGQWQYSTHTPPYVGVGYLHDQKQGKGTSSVTYRPDLPRAGTYEVRLSHCYNVRRSINTPVTIHHADGETTVRINQQQIPEHQRLFRTLGTFRFEEGKQGWLRISTDGTDGKYVIADAVQFIPSH